jgi:hypothetical protein
MYFVQTWLEDHFDGGAFMATLLGKTLIVCIFFPVILIANLARWLDRAATETGET